MRASWSSLTALGGSVLLAATAVAANPRTAAIAPVRPIAQPAAQPSAQPTAQPAAPPADASTQREREVQTLLDQLSKVSDTLMKNAEGPDSWRYQTQQAEVLLHLAARAGDARERDNWLKSAIDSYFSAAVQCPATEASGQQRMSMLPDHLAKHFAGTPLVSYAARQEIQSAHLRALAAEGADQAKVKEELRHRLVRFAADNPRAPEAPAAMLEAAELSEAVGHKEDANRCYRHLAESYAGQEVARKARGALARLGAMTGEKVALSLPLIYASGDGATKLDTEELRGRVVLIHCWKADAPGAAEAFAAIRKVTDQGRGIEVVYVNLDGDAAKARAFLASNLTNGIHVSEPKDTAVSIQERFGLPTLPATLVVGRDGTLLRHSLQAGTVEETLDQHAPASRNVKR